MKLTGLLVGAGFSCDAGMPLVNELTKTFKSEMAPEHLQRYCIRQKALGGGFPPTVIEDVVSTVHRSAMNYEDILGYLETQSQRRFQADAYHHFHSLFLELIYHLLYQRTLQVGGLTERYIEYFKGITTLLQDNAPLWIFSLNYDLVVEFLAAHAGIPINYGYTSDKISLPRRSNNDVEIGTLEAQVLPGRVIEEEALPFYRVGETGINLLKLHGSLDVFAYRDGKDLIKIIPQTESIEGLLQVLRWANNELIDPKLNRTRVRPMNEIAVVDSSKETQFLQRSLLAGAFKFDRASHQVIPNKLLDHFISNLNFLETLVCIGYSFGDSHVNSIVRRWLEFRSERQLHIVDPNRNSVPKFARHLSPQVQLLDLEATDFLDRIGSIERTEAEQFFRKLLRYATKNPSEFEHVLPTIQENLDTHMRTEFEKWIQTLPIRNNDIDLESLGLNAEEFTEKALLHWKTVFGKFVNTFKVD